MHPIALPASGHKLGKLCALSGFLSPHAFRFPCVCKDGLPNTKSGDGLMFRRLAIFVGGFSLAAALRVTSEGLDPAELTETVATLVDKSLVTSDRGSAAHYRLLETTRAYAWQKLGESGEYQKIARRHCEQLTEALEKFGAQIWARPSPESIDFFAANLSNLRAALDWCFSDQGDNALGARLSGASAPLFFQAGLLAHGPKAQESDPELSLDPRSVTVRFQPPLEESQMCVATYLKSGSPSGLRGTPSPSSLMAR
jgi:hypothetical protein